MNSTDSRCIHSIQSSRVVTWETSHACFKWCWLTTILVASAGGAYSGALLASLNARLGHLGTVTPVKLTINRRHLRHAEVALH